MQDFVHQPFQGSCKDTFGVAVQTHAREAWGSGGGWGWNLFLQFCWFRILFDLEFLFIIFLVSGFSGFCFLFRVSFLV